MDYQAKHKGASFLYKKKDNNSRLNQNSIFLTHQSGSSNAKIAEINYVKIINQILGFRRI